jgi:pimeloyl-ACP methyl ester carboxylesterase
MKPLPGWFRTFVRVAAVFPPVATAIAWRLFWMLGTPAAVRPSELETHRSARISELTIDGKTVAVYTWGSGDQTVLLVHGWRSRASRFSSIVDALVARGYNVVAFDAPGNGASSGTRTDLFEYVAIVRELGARFGPFEAVIAHSFGAIAAFAAKRDGARIRRIVSIAGAHDFDSIVATFSRGIGLPNSRGLRRRIERWSLSKGVDPWLYAVAELDPTDYGTPVLVIHDSADIEVGLEQAALISEAHTGIVETLITDGLGHHRILGDPDVIARVTSFVDAPIGREQPTR